MPEKGHWLSHCEMGVSALARDLAVFLFTLCLDLVGSIPAHLHSLYTTAEGPDLPGAESDAE